MSENFEIETAHQLKIIKLSGNLINRPWMDDLIRETDNSIENGISNFIIDLQEVELMNSSGISMLVNILTKARRSGGDVILCNVNEKVERLMLITKLNTIFSIMENLQQAKNHFEVS